MHRLAFDAPDALVRSLAGCDVLINTYWVRFNHRQFSFAQAVENTQRLFDAARAAGVRRIVHTSILKPAEGHGLGYYEGKLRLEHDLAETGLSHSILRPGVLFGRGDILVNNIAWALRHLPVFGVFGRGDYRLAPLHVEDFAALAVRAADADPALPTVVDCHGPETFSYRELVRTLAACIEVRRPVVPVPPRLGYWVTQALKPLVGDVIITREEIAGLMRGLLWSEAPSLGTTKLTEWARQRRETLGRNYASELARRTQRATPYERL